MKQKILLFVGLSVLIILVGLPMIFKQNWSLFSRGNKQQRPLVTDTLSNATVFNKLCKLSLQELIGDSARLMFRFTPNTCSCLELDFAEAVKRMMTNIDGRKIIVIVAAADNKELFFFCERTKLSCPVYGTNDTSLTSFDIQQMPYACVVFPDMAARNIVTIDSNNIDELISYAKKNIP